MLKKKRIGMIVWGAILTSLGTVYLLFCAINVMQGLTSGSTSSSPRTLLIILVFSLLLLSGGVVLLVFGILNAVKTERYNRSISHSSVYVAQCYTCRTQVRCSIADFQTHRRFPEGFVYCPVCRRPLSRNAFTVYPAEGANGNSPL